MLEKLVKELPDLLQRNTDLLTGDNVFGFNVIILHDVIEMTRNLCCLPPESERMLREESESDSSLRAQHGAKWSRTPSDKLTATFTANANKYRTIINNATQADSMVKEKLNTHMAGMQVVNGRFSGSKGQNLSFRPCLVESPRLPPSFLRGPRVVEVLALLGDN